MTKDSDYSHPHRRASSASLSTQHAKRQRINIQCKSLEFVANLHSYRKQNCQLIRIALHSTSYCRCHQDGFRVVGHH